MHLFKWLSASVYLYLVCIGAVSASTEKNHLLQATAQPSAQHHWPTPKAIPSNVTTLIQASSLGDIPDSSDNHGLTHYDITLGFGLAASVLITPEYLAAPNSIITCANQSRAPPAIKS